MADLTAVGDQVQEVLAQCGRPVIGFVIFDTDGTVEYRARLTLDELRVELRKIADAL